MYHLTFICSPSPRKLALSLPCIHISVVQAAWGTKCLGTLRFEDHGYSWTSKCSKHVLANEAWERGGRYSPLWCSLLPAGPLSKVNSKTDKLWDRLIQRPVLFRHMLFPLRKTVALYWMQQHEKSRECQLTWLNLPAFCLPTPGNLRLDYLPPCINHAAHRIYLLAELLWKKKFEAAHRRETGPQAVQSPSVQMPAAMCALLCSPSPAVMQLFTFRGRRGREVIQPLLICCCLNESSDAKGRMWMHKCMHIRKPALCSTNTKSSEFIQPCSLVLDVWCKLTTQWAPFH